MSNSQYVPSYMKKATPPPQVEIGDKFEAEIEEIRLEEGEYGQQYKFNLRLEGGEYAFKAWVKAYEVPTTASHLGQLCLATEKATGQRFETVNGSLKALKSLGRVYVKVKGHREYGGQQYPKFSIVPDEIPIRQGRLSEEPEASGVRIA